MPSSVINAITIDSLKRPFSFDGEFVLLSESDLISVFSKENSFKTKFYTLLFVESGSGNLLVDHKVYKIQAGRVFLPIITKSFALRK